MNPRKFGDELHSRLVMLGLLACILSLASGCTLVPTPVRLSNKPFLLEPEPSGGKNICLIVRDERPQPIQKINMSGITRTTIFMIPTSFAFLAHTEHLDAIVAHHAKKLLERQGYTVIKSYPEAPSTLSPNKAGTVSLSKDDKNTAWELAKNQKEDDVIGRMKKSRNAKEAEVENLDEDFISAWGPGIDTSGADAVIEVKIRKFWTDYNYFGSYSWVSSNLALCDPKDPKRKVLFGKKVRGLGYFFSFFTPLTPGSDIPVSMNGAYWVMLHSIEKMINSEEFRKELANR